ncbi:MAG TPA: ArsA-related P-loop ATPase [Acidimicrobiales bacterium]
MDPLQLFASSGLVIVAGKGGVGKTTVTAAMAIAAARLGQRVLAVEMEGASGLGPLLGSERALGPEDVLLRPGRPDQPGEVLGRVVSPGEALTDYLNDHGLRRMSGRLAKAGVIDVVATAAPGLDDILVLGKIKQLERGGEYDLILLDAPAAGHAVTFLRSAKGLADAVTVGPISTQAHDVLELLNDASRCQVVLVTLPEETPVNETIDTAFTLEDEVGLQLGPVVVNGLYPDRSGLAAALDTLGPEGERTHDGLVRAARFRLARQAQQTEQLARLSARLPLPQVHLPYVFTAGLSNQDVEVLAERLLDQLGSAAA